MKHITELSGTHCTCSMSLWSLCFTDEQKQQQFLDAKNLAVVSRCLYSPGWTPCDFFLFPRMKLQIWGHVF